MVSRLLFSASLMAVAGAGFAQTALPQADLERLKLSERFMNREGGEKSSRYEVGGHIANRSAWELTSVEVEFIDKTRKPWVQTRFKVSVFNGQRTGTKGNLMPGDEARLAGTAAIWGTGKHTYWATIVSATGFRWPDPAAYQGGRPAEVCRGNDQAGKAMLESPSPGDPTPSQILTLAALGNCSDLIGALRKAGVKVDEPTDTGYTPLELAASVNSGKAVAALVKAGAKVNGREEFLSPIEMAAREGASDSLLALLRARASVKPLSEGGTSLLHWASRYECNFEALSALVRAGIPVDVKNEKGQTPLYYATLYGSPDQVRFLARLGASVQEGTEYGSPLHIAAGKNDMVEVIRALIEVGADPDALDKTVETPLHRAAGWKHLDCVQELIKAKADVTIGTPKGNTALHLAARKGYTEVSSALIAGGAPLDARNKIGETPLHEAVRMNRPLVVDLLLKAGASSNVRDNEGRSPIDLADELNKPDLVRRLKVKGSAGG